MIERSENLIQSIILFSTFATTIAVTLYTYLICFTSKNKLNFKLVDILTYIIVYHFACIFIFCQFKGFKNDIVMSILMMKYIEISAIMYFFDIRYWILPIIILDFHIENIHLLILPFS